LIVILGPTASGKSELALKLAKLCKGGIINADSRQIYKDMIIGTGSPVDTTQKPKLKVQGCKSKSKTKMKGCRVIHGINHYLFHFIRPSEPFSVAEYKKLAINTIRDMQNRGILPILVGGTGLYISAIVDNLEIPEAPPNLRLRKQLEKKSAKKLFGMLKKIDSRSASLIGPNNKRKIIRSLEVYQLTGKPFSSQQVKGEPLFNVLEIGIKSDRSKLYKKIDQRVDEMIENGLINETKYLVRKYKSDLPAMTGIGYEEISQYLRDDLGLEEASQLIKYRTHHYARRQETWFKRDKKIKWVKNCKDAERLAKSFLK